MPEISTQARKSQFELTVRADKADKPDRIFYGKLNVTTEWLGFAGYHTTHSWELDSMDGEDMQVCAMFDIPYALIDRETGEFELVLYKPSRKRISFDLNAGQTNTPEGDTNG